MTAPGAFHLTYRRTTWESSTASRFRAFDSLDDALAFLNRLRQRPGELQARLEKRDVTGRWVEIMIGGAS